MVKEEDDSAIIPELDILACLDGFSLVLGAEGEIIYVSKNVSGYMGLKPVELLGQTMSDYIHPCDLSYLASLTKPLADGELQRGEATVRMKCTVTERGRIVNLNQARIDFLQTLTCSLSNSTGVVQATSHHWTDLRACQTRLRIVRSSFHRDGKPYQPSACSLEPAWGFHISPLPRHEVLS